MEDAITALLPWFVLWVVFGIIGAGIAKTFRGRELAGMLLGFFMGPLGWLCIFALGDDRLKCPECGGVVPQGAKRCKSCGVYFVIGDSAPETAVPVRR